MFVAVLNGNVVGYAIYQWHSRITDVDRNVLGHDGQPLSPRPIRVLLLGEFLEMVPDDLNRTLEAWCLEFVVVEPEFQRYGIGQRLLRCAAESLGTTLEDMAYGEPIGDAGKALLSSLGPSLDEVRRCLA